MQIDKRPFLVNTIDLQEPKVLLRPHQSKAAKGKSVVISEPRIMHESNKFLRREVVLSNTPDGKETFKITVKGSRLGGQKSSSQASETPGIPDKQENRPVPISKLVQSGFAQGLLKTFKPKRPEVRTWKTNKSQSQGKVLQPKVTVDQPISKYLCQKAVRNDRPQKIRSRPIKLKIQPCHKSQMPCPLLLILKQVAVIPLPSMINRSGVLLV